MMAGMRLTRLVHGEVEVSTSVLLVRHPTLDRTEHPTARGVSVAGLPGHEQDGAYLGDGGAETLVDERLDLDHDLRLGSVQTDGECTTCRLDSSAGHTQRVIHYEVG